MANKISIEFAAKGHPGVIKAVKALNKEVTKLATVNRLLNDTTQPLTQSQKEVAKGFLAQQKAARNTAGAFSVLRSKMLLASFGASLFAGSLLRLTNMAGDAEEQMSKAAVVFGNSFNSMTGWSKSFGDTVNRSRFDLLKFAASVQDILVPMGLMRHEAAKLSKGIVELAVDVGSFSNVASADVMRDFNSALVGNHETVRKYGIVISEARMQQVAMDEGIIKSGESLSDQQKILARLAILQRDSTDAIGDAERTSQSYANVMQGLAAQFEETAIIIGKELMPVIKALANVLIVVLKVIGRPAIWATAAVAIGYYTKSIIAARIATFAFKRQVVAARIAVTKLMKRTVILLAVAVAFEAMIALYNRLKIPKATLDDVVDLNTQLERLQQLAAGMSREDMQFQFDVSTDVINSAKAEIEILQKSIKDLRDGADEDLPDAMQHLSDKETQKEINKLNNQIEVLQVKLRGAKTRAEFFGDQLDTLNSKSEQFAKQQQSMTDALKDLNATFLVRKQILNEDFEIASKNQIAYKKFGMSFSDLKKESKESAKEIEEFVKTQAKNVAINKKLNLKTQIANLKEQSAAQRFLNTQKAKGVVINKDDAESIKKLFDEYEKLKQQQAVEADLDSLREREALLKAQVDKGKELNEVEKFNVMLKFSKANLTKEEADAYKELLGNIDEYNAKIAESQQSTGGSKSSGTSQDDIDLLQAELDALRNQVTPAIDQFREDILSGMTLFGSGGMGIFGINAFREVSSAFGNYVTNVQDNNKAIEQSFVDRQAEIDKMDTSTLDAQKKKLEAEIKLEEDQIERLEEVEQAKNDVRANAQQMAFDVFNQFMSMRKEAVQNELNAELETLKQSGEYQRASDKKKEKMESEVRKKYAKEQIKLFRMDQAAKLASIGMSTGDAIMKAVSAFPLTAGAPWTYIIGAMGAAQAGMVLAQKPPKYARGGIVGGNLHSMGGTLIEAEKGEYVMSRKAVDSIGQEQLNAMNRTGSAGNNINITLSGNVLSDDFVADEFIPKLEERIRVLSDGTITDRFS